MVLREHAFAGVFGIHAAPPTQPTATPTPAGSSVVSGLAAPSRLA